MYNSMSRLPFIPYNILTYLAQNDEILWKLLAYNDYDALSKPNLTFSEKLNLLWKTGPQEPYNIFFTNLVEDAIPESKCILKIYQYYIHASQLYNSTVVYAFDFLYGGKMSLVEYNGLPVSRADLFVNRICKVTAMETTEDYKLRHSKFMGFRDDITIQDCTFDKIFKRGE